MGNHKELQKIKPYKIYNRISLPPQLLYISNHIEIFVLSWITHLEKIAISEGLVTRLHICAVSKMLHIYKPLSKRCQTLNKLRAIERGKNSTLIELDH